MLESNGFTLPITNDQVDGEGKRIHTRAFLFLKEKVQEHLITESDPKLSLLPKPTGAYTWQPDPTTISSLDLANETSFD